MNLTETMTEESEMRSDYSLYIVALICFMIAGVILGMDQTISQVSTVSIAIFVILGVLFIAGGYTLRPKALGKVPETPTISTIETIPTSTPPPSPPTEEQVPFAPTAPPPPAPPPEEAPTPAPAPAMEEPAKVEEEKPAEKPVRRRRRKKTA